MDRLRVAGVIAAICGALLIVSLLLDWWGYPAAFDDPAALPDAARFTADAVATSGRPLDADAFQFFEFRDIVWLVAGMVIFGFGLMVLVIRRVLTLPAVAAGALAVAAAVLIALALISPPDFTALGPAEAKPLDLGADLPLDPEPGGFVALAAALGCAIGAGVALINRR